MLSNRSHSFLFADLPGHGLDALSSVVLIVTVAGDVLQVVHVGSYQHGPQLHEVAVGRVLHCAQKKIYIRAGQISVAMVTVISKSLQRLGTDSHSLEFLTLHNAPRVEPPPHSLTSGFYHSVAADHRERSALLHHKTGSIHCLYIK